MDTEEEKDSERGEKKTLRDVMKSMTRSRKNVLYNDISVLYLVSSCPPC